MPRRFLVRFAPLAVIALAACGTVDAADERPVAPAPTRPGAETTVTVAPTLAPETTGVADTTTTPATTVAPESVAQAGVVSLTPEGVGVAAFGDAADTTETALVASLGPATVDSGWVDALSSPFGVCPGTFVRGLRWGPLQVLFTDDGTARTMFTYVYASSLVQPGEAIGAASGLQTPEGIGLGSSLGDLQGAYPALEVATDAYGPTFATAAEGGLAGTLSSEGPEGFVTGLVGGSFCGG
jgi:hypothetical protein